MREIWSEQRKLEIWLQIELLASQVLCAEGLVPRKDFEQMKARAAFSVERCKELERTLNHGHVVMRVEISSAEARKMLSASDDALGSKPIEKCRCIG